MHIGAVFPQLEIGNNHQDIKAWAQSMELFGYDHIAIFDHILGVKGDSYPNWSGPYDHTHSFHEPLVLMGYLSAVTTKIEFATSVLVLPQRQAALVAKQASTISILSKRQIRLGVGSGWNEIEFNSLGYKFSNRGERIEDQIKVMKELWTKRSVGISTPHHTIIDAGIHPLPKTHPIQIWLGGGATPVLKRIGQLADGWFANTSTRTAMHTKVPAFSRDKTGLLQLEVIRKAALDSGRNPKEIGVEVRIELEGKTPEIAAQEVLGWQQIPEVTSIQFSAMRSGLQTVNAHIDAMNRFIDALRN